MKQRHQLQLQQALIPILLEEPAQQQLADANQQQQNRPAVAQAAPAQAAAALVI
jgi:hypothetical protein